ncbi:MAG: hypothetical protein K8T26_11475 [Lentisphaerae bacterium]|nr:hypothetical protein [Lentisphaerota bacterium]
MNSSDGVDVLHVVRKAAVAVAQEEDKELRQLCGEGIFWMPELAFAYAVGKHAIKVLNSGNRNESPYQWRRETQIDGQGPVDLIIMEPSGTEVVVEFKMRDTESAYVADINKLHALKSNNPSRRAAFCVLCDAWDDHWQDDPRLQVIQRLSSAGEPSVRPIGDAVPIQTVQNRYAGKIACVVAMWEVV